MDNSSQATTGALSTGFLLWGSLPLSLLLLPASPVPTLPAWVTDAGEPLVLLPLSGQAAALRPPRVPNFPSPSGPGALEGTGTRQGLGVEPPSQAQVLIPLCRHSLKLSKARPGLRPVSVGSSDTNTTSPAVTHTAHSAPRTLQKHHPSSLAPLPVLPNGPRSRSAIFLGSTLMRSGTHRGTWSCPPLQPLLSSPLLSRTPEPLTRTDSSTPPPCSTLLTEGHQAPPRAATGDGQDGSPALWLPAALRGDNTGGPPRWWELTGRQRGPLTELLSDSCPRFPLRPTQLERRCWACLTAVWLGQEAPGRPPLG